MYEYLAIAAMTKIAVSWEQKFSPDIKEKPLQSPKVVSNFSGVAALAKALPPVVEQKQANVTKDDISLKEWLEARRKARGHSAMRDMNIEARSLPNV